MRQAKNFSISVCFCENLASCFTIVLALKVVCPCVGGAKWWQAQYDQCCLFVVSIFSFGAKYGFFLFDFSLSILGVFKRNFHSKLQRSAEPRRKPNYVKYSDLLAQKLNAVLQFSVYVPGATHRYKILVLRFPSCTHSISYCKAEVLLDCCVVIVLPKK